MGDLVKATISEQQFIIEQLGHYWAAGAGTHGSPEFSRPHQ